MKAARIPLFTAFMASSWAAQGATEFQESVPLETAEIFLGIGPEDGGLYTDIPDAFPLDPPPSGFTIVGSVVQQNTQTVHLHTTLEDAVARDSLTDVLEAQGWIAFPSPFSATPDLGFTDPRGNQVPLQLCHDEQGSLQVNGRPHEGGSVVTVRLVAGPRPFGQQSCSEQLESRTQTAARRTPDNPLVEYIPRMVLPVEADFGGRMPGRSGSVSTSRDGMEIETMLSIDWERERVYDYFADMIGTQGWSLEGGWTTPSTTGGSWTRTADGTELLGVFNVLQKGSGDYILHFRLVTR